MRHPLRGRARLRRHRQGPDPRHDRPDGHGRRRRPRRRVRRPGDRGALDGGPDDDLQHDDRGRRPRRHDRARRHHVRVVRGAGRPGAPEDLEAAVAGWRELRTDAGASFDKEVVVDAAALSPAGHLGHDARRWSRRSPTPSRAALRRRRARAEVHGPRGRHADAGDRARPRVHRLVHQLADRRPARRRRGGQGPQGRRQRQRDGRARLPAGRDPGRAGGPRRGLPRRRLRLAQRGLLDVPGDEPRHPRRRASAAPRRRTATSRAARAAAGAPTSCRPQMAAAAAIEGRFVDIREWS